MISKDSPVKIVQPSEKVHILEDERKTACGLKVSEEEKRDKISVNKFKEFFSLRFDLCGTCENSKTFLKVLEWSEEKND